MKLRPSTTTTFRVLKKTPMFVNLQYSEWTRTSEIIILHLILALKSATMPWSLKSVGRHRAASGAQPAPQTSHSQEKHLGLLRNPSSFRRSFEPLALPEFLPRKSHGPGMDNEAPPPGTSPAPQGIQAMLRRCFMHESMGGWQCRRERTTRHEPGLPAGTMDGTNSAHSSAKGRGAGPHARPAANDAPGGTRRRLAQRP